MGSMAQPGGLLTAAERQKLLTNITGYDISPDMVRLSLVNLYLHGFANPQILEYDTLTSDAHWGEAFDVILANPPFMTPKGGIRPHNRFAIQAKRSEVLFVDYIAEHLAPQGRAGVIVPEGIIFQSQNAYKALRKMLVDGGFLWAVVSLPAGIFQPYSGVKTSVLLLDRQLARRADHILFVKLAHDGLDLGAQRRPIDQNDLPAALDMLQTYQRTLQFAAATALAHAVPKAQIAANGDYNLSGDRYRQNASQENSQWQMVTLKDVVTLYNETINPLDYSDEAFLHFSIAAYDSGVPVIEKGESIKSAKKLIQNDDILISKLNPHIPRVWYIADERPYRKLASTEFLPLRIHTTTLLHKYLRNILLTDTFFEQVCKLVASTSKSHSRADAESILNLQIPLPPLDAQRRIVAELEGYQKIIDGAKQVVAHWKPEIKMDVAWEKVNVESVLNEVKYTNKIKSSEFLENGRYPIIDQSEKFIAGYWNNENDLFRIQKPIIIFGDHTRIFKYIDFDFVLGADGVKILAPNDQFIPKFFYYVLKNVEIRNLGYSRHFKELKDVQIPVPPLDVQREIVARIEEEAQIIAANRRLIALYDAKIRAALAAVWVA